MSRRLFGRRVSAAAASFALVLLLGAPMPLSAADEPAWAVGDRVLTDVNMSHDPAYQNWRPGTVLEILMWQGQISGIVIRTDDGLVITTAPHFMKRGAPKSEPPPAPAHETPAAKPTGPPPGSATAPGGEAAKPAADPGTGNCRVGLRVVDREGRTGVVVRATGASCHVKLDDTGEEDYYLQWMLTPAGAATTEGAGGGGPQPGTYTCWAALGNAGTFRLVILDGSRYANGDGTEGAYSHDAASGQIRWTSGPWAGYYGQVLAPGRLGISSRPGGFSATTCDLRGRD